MVALRGGAVSYERGTPVAHRLSPEASIYVPRRACLSRGGPVCPEAGLPGPWRGCLSRDVKEKANVDGDFRLTRPGTTDCFTTHLKQCV